MAGTLTISTLSDGTNSTSSTNCIQGSAKAWVNFNGTTSPGTIRASYNVGSVTKNATGDYTLNFTNALADGNFSVVSIADGPTSAGICLVSPYNTQQTAASSRIRVWNTGFSLSDTILCCVAVFR